ncbi:hypothetical protein M426DRAFT_260092 [Hypoxylon sp. CI-4A]|nr:hypothetical protein M426DRAFT_260092 [Hypoxylon sp. CI-4A]
MTGLDFSSPVVFVLGMSKGRSVEKIETKDQVSSLQARDHGSLQGWSGLCVRLSKVGQIRIVIDVPSPRKQARVIGRRGRLRSSWKYWREVVAVQGRKRRSMGMDMGMRPRAVHVDCRCKREARDDDATYLGYVSRESGMRGMENGSGKLKAHVGPPPLPFSKLQLRDFIVGPSFQLGLFDRFPFLHMRPTFSAAL